MFRNTRKTATSPAATTPTIWLFPPVASLTTVLEESVAVANPWKRPVEMFAAPIATNSRLVSNLVAVLSCKHSRRQHAVRKDKHGHGESRRKECSQVGQAHERYLRHRKAARDLADDGYPEIRKVEGRRHDNGGKPRPPAGREPGEHTV